MRWFKFLFSLIITCALVYLLATPISTPFSLGELFNPFTGFWHNAASQELEPSFTLDLEGLEDQVVVAYDSLGIPHIFAQNDHDLFMAQGYVTARDRLWQMEFQTHAAAGRLTELIGRGPGDRVLEIDRGRRRKGMKWAAERLDVELMKNEQAKAILEAYTAGVNAYINSLDPESYPIEYKILNYQPEAWTTVKVAYLLKYMSEMLTGGTDDMRYTNALQSWGPDIFKQLYPLRPYAEDPIIPIEERYRFRDVKLIPKPERYHPDSIMMAGIGDIVEPSLHIGSNNWAVHGSKSKSGRPLLANDPHLGLNLPSIWYAIQLHSPTVNAMGVSLPGAPNIIIGFNDSIAWGMTNAGRDVMDYYKITFRGRSKTHYRVGNDWVEDSIRIEEYKIKDGESFYDTLIMTQFGPVMYDEHFGPYEVPLACRWIAHEPSEELLTSYYLNRANNYEDYRKALNYYACPAQNFVFASASGDVAITQQGKFVNRWEEQGRFILDAADSTHEWQGYIPFEQNPTTLNPRRGFVSSANQMPTSARYPYHYQGVYEEFRNRRLNQLLGTKDSMTVTDMMAFQQDNYSVMAADILPLMLSEIDSSRLNTQQYSVFQKLRLWSSNCMYDPEKTEPTIFDLWWDLLYFDIWEDEFTEAKQPLRYPDDATTLQILRDSAVFRFYDNTGTTEKEDRKALIVASFKHTIDSLYRYDEDPAKWGWADFKQTTATHLTRVFPSFSRSNLPIGGNRGILNAASSTHGPSWRMVVHLGKKVEAYGVYPGGQSGDPAMRGYDSFIDDWAAGNYYRLTFMKSASETAGVTQTMRLE
jgi:penicillin amidase